jgi:Zn-dependent peptidase ImmA (M78 family)
MMTLERGFKSWCERSAVAIRAELSIEPHQPLKARQLAEHLGVGLLAPEDLPGLDPKVLHQLTHKDPQGWSAVSFTVDGETTIIYNNSNSPGRQSSDIMHELSHVILGHAPTQIILSVDGEMAMRTFDAKQEDEANWLGWTLLLPRPALVRCATLRLNDEQIAEEYGVSTTLVEYRRNMTGVATQMRRRTRRKA